MKLWAEIFVVVLHLKFHPALGFPKVDDWKSQRFDACCKHANIKPHCQFLCKYDLDPSELLCGVHDCYNDFQRWTYCAADSINTNPNWACCKRLNVSDICEPFCRGTSPRPDELISVSYYRCLFETSSILQCHAENVPNWPQYFNRNPQFQQDVVLSKDQTDLIQQVTSGCKDN